MGALFFLFLMGLYISFIIFLVKKFSRFKVAIIIFFIFISFGDEIYGRYKLNKMCETHAGIHIYETVKDVEGFEVNFHIHKDWLEKYGYQFIIRDSDIMNISSDGVITVNEIHLNRSKYKVTHQSQETNHINGWYSLDGFYIIRKSDNKILSDYVIVGYSGGWITRLLQKIYATRTISVRCNPDELSFNYITLDAIINQTLQPKP